MKNNFISLLLGLLGVGWLSLMYEYFFDYLYISIALAPKVAYCKALIETDLCHFVAYVGLWISEIPLLVVSFALYFGIAVYILKKLSLIPFCWPLVMFGYVLCYEILVYLDGFEFTLYGLLCGIYQALVGVSVMYAALCLARLST
ncbi:hypothetical protein [Teredinibacter turnerae]|uniref:hypothetical protein n=1 Tax=Teredinibacter turnerae TaxID=2426 RepID=UPI0030CF067D